MLLVPSALCAGFVIFVAGVIRGITNDVDEATFKCFLTELVKHAFRSSYVVCVGSITFVGIIPYFIYYGVSDWWFTADLILWVVTSIVSKVTTFPIHKTVHALERSEVVRLQGERRKKQSANILCAKLAFATVIHMASEFIEGPVIGAPRD